MWRLREITLTDFKSFDGEHVFSPLDAYKFSCVVGLNGSGKSNIVDALSFVLGSNSKSLRSARFADLCHKDRITGKPIAQKAKVKVVFVDIPETVVAAANDTQETEPLNSIAFERIVSADSSTMYLINGRPTDRKMYNKNLIDIGAYGKGCIIAQGYIESISLSSAQEKGQLLDSLSGSAALKDEYEAKQKKAMTLALELKAVVARKDDAEQIVRNLKKQFQDLKTYEAAKMKMTRAQMKLHALNLAYSNWQLSSVDQKIAELESEQKKYVDEIATRQKDIQQDVSQQRQIAERVRKLKSDLRQLLQHTSARREAKLAAEHERDQLDVNIRLANDRLDTYRTQYSDLKNEYKQSMRQLSDLMNELGQKKAAIERALASNEFRNLPKERQSVITDLSRRSRNEKEIADITAAMDVLNMKSAKCDTRLADLRARASTLEAKEKALKSQKTELDRSTAALESQREEFERFFAQERETLLNLTSAQNLAKSLKDELYGSHHADAVDRNAHVVAHLAKQYPERVFGRLKDLITVTNPQHILAINAALGRQRDSIIVDSFDDAVECIRILKQKHWGVEEFIPIQGKDRQRLVLQHLRQQPNVFRPAVDCVAASHPNGRIMDAVASVLGDTVIVEGDLDRARHLAFRDRVAAGLKIVTTDGQRIAKNGNITLGNTGNIGGRVANRPAQEAKLAQASQTAKALEEQYNQQFSSNLVVEKRSALEALREQLRLNHSQKLRVLASEDEVKQTQALVERDLAHQEELLKRIKEEIESKMLARTKAAEKVPRVSPEDQQLIAAYNEAMEGEHQLQLLEQEELREIRNRVNKLTVVLQEAGVVDESFSSSGAWRELLINVTKRVEDLLKKKPKLAETTDYIKEMEEQRKLVERRIEESGSSETASREAELTAAIEEQDKSLVELRRRSKTLHDSLRSLMTAKNKVERDIYEQCVRKKEIEDERQQQEQNAMISADTQVEDMMVDDEQEEVTSEREFQKQKDRMQREIDECADGLNNLVVNHQAEEMLNAAKAKQQEILHEYEEKKGAKHLTDLDLVQLRETRKSLFLKCFNSVNKALDDIYVRLTAHAGGGSIFGTAQIELEDEISSEPFNKGVIFHVIPPGKRYTDLDSLSGGEKAMAALSLLFACQQFKKSPFIVLDEVDAPLDLENLASLRDYLRNSDLQVLMITLKEEVYCAADAIIGVYKSPQDHNSKTLTVSLKEFPLSEPLPVS